MLIMNSKWIPVACLMIVWAIAVYIVDPVGEFLINDDFGFATALQNVMNGRALGPTWLGPQGSGGGPALFVHLLWGQLFSNFFGHSFTILRVSVLVLSITGSLAFFFLLRSTNAGDWLSFWGTLTLIFNPLYFSQSFTYMTDVTFISLTIFSFLMIHWGIEKNILALVVIGLFFALSATLTRQFGLFIALAFVVTCFIHPLGRRFGFRKAVVLALVIVVIPWVSFEYFLHRVGSTPFTDHQLLNEILSFPAQKGFPDYLVFVTIQLSQNVLGYTCLAISPVVALLYRQYLDRNRYQCFFVLVSVFFGVLVLGIYSGWFSLPIFLNGNVVFNLGIGPILLKDTYILGIKRMVSLPSEIYYIIFWWTVLSVGLVLPLVWKSMRDISKTILGSAKNTSESFLTYFTLIFILLYVWTISLTGIRDRYTIPIAAMTIVFLFSFSNELRNFKFSIRNGFPAFVAFGMIGFFALSATHDFMSMKRSQTKALNYLTNDLGIPPNHIDGGFEFNGYYCFDKDFQPKEGRSWWWVDREDYVITLGDLSGYETVKRFPFCRIIGQDGVIHILKPLAVKSR